MAGFESTTLYRECGVGSARGGILGTACWGLFANQPNLGWMPGLVAGLIDDDQGSHLVRAEQVIVGITDTHQQAQATITAGRSVRHDGR